MRRLSYSPRERKDRHWDGISKSAAPWFRISVKTAMARISRSSAAWATDSQMVSAMESADVRAAAWSGLLHGWSRLRHDAAIMATASRGYLPLAVSAESITASVAVENGVGHVAGFGARGTRVLDHRFQHLRGRDHRLAPSAARRMMCFWIEGTFSGGISTPRSPRATMTPSATSRISSRLLDGLRLFQLGDHRRRLCHRLIISASPGARRQRCGRRKPRRYRRHASCRSSDLCGLFRSAKERSQQCRAD